MENIIIRLLNMTNMTVKSILVKAFSKKMPVY